jgi:potassium-transporting ATPase KdpC subunit
MREHVRPAIVLLLLFMAITGLTYPLLTTGIAQAVFPRQANGSLVVRAGQAVGSELIGQPFDDPRYFWGRPSATAPFPYNAAASAGSNLGPSNLALRRAVEARIAALRSARLEDASSNRRPIPADLVTASGSGLDPHISLAAALYQVPRVARARGMDQGELQQLVARYVEGRQLGILGEPRVHVLNLNLALDALQ